MDSTYNSKRSRRLILPQVEHVLILPQVEHVLILPKVEHVPALGPLVVLHDRWIGLGGGALILPWCSWEVVL